MAKKGKPSYEDLQDKIKRLESRLKLVESALQTSNKYVVQYAFEWWVACPINPKQQDAVIRQICSGETPGFAKLSEKVLKDEEGIKAMETIWMAPNFLPGYSHYVVRHEIVGGEHRSFRAWALLPC